MGKKDIQAHEFLVNNARFADLCNCCVWQMMKMLWEI